MQINQFLYRNDVATIARALTKTPGATMAKAAMLGASFDARGPVGVETSVQKFLLNSLEHWTGLRAWANPYGLLTLLMTQPTTSARAACS